MKRILTIFITVIITVTTLCSSAFCEDAPVLRKIHVLQTSNNANYYTLFKLDNNTINFEGRYTSDPVQSVTITGSLMSNYSDDLHMETNGTFSGYIKAIPNNSYEYINIVLLSGYVMHVRIMYDRGWYFPDVGIAAENNAMLSTAALLPPEVTKFYIDENGDDKVVRETLDTISILAKQITDGMTDDYDKALALSEWVATNIYYDKDAQNTMVDAGTVSLNNVLENRRTVCAGFANLYSALLEAVGIRSLNIKGCTDPLFENLYTVPQNHEWVAFFYEADSRFVYVDSTWNTNNRYENGNYSSNGICRQYFDATDYVLAFNHRSIKVEERHYFASLPTAETTETAAVDTLETATETAISASAEVTVTTAKTAPTTSETALTTTISETTVYKEPSRTYNDTTVSFDEKENSVNSFLKNTQLFTLLIVGAVVLVLIAIGVGIFIIHVQKRK